MGACPARQDGQGPSHCPSQGHQCPGPCVCCPFPWVPGPGSQHGCCRTPAPPVLPGMTLSPATCTATLSIPLQPGERGCDCTHSEDRETEPWLRLPFPRSHREHKIELGLERWIFQLRIFLHWVPGVHTSQLCLWSVPELPAPGSQHVFLALAEPFSWLEPHTTYSFFSCFLRHCVPGLCAHLAIHVEGTIDQELAAPKPGPGGHIADS